MDTIGTILASVNTLALGILAYWIRSLKGAVDAQRETIAAQKQFIEGLKTVLDTTDTPKMLERVEAIKKFVEHEKEAFVRDVKLKVERYLNQSSAIDALMSDALISLIPYIPILQRNMAIDSMKVPDEIKNTLKEFADRAPDFHSQLAVAYLTGLVPGITLAPSAPSITHKEKK